MNKRIIFISLMVFIITSHSPSVLLADTWDACTDRCLNKAAQCDYNAENAAERAKCKRQHESCINACQVSLSPDSESEQNAKQIDTSHGSSTEDEISESSE